MGSSFSTRCPNRAADAVGLSGAGVWVGGVGLVFGLAAVGAVLGCSWQAQDHLDTQEPFPLPDVTDGMVVRVAAALAASRP